jgi:hypothetical protein
MYSKGEFTNPRVGRRLFPDRDRGVPKSGRGSATGFFEGSEIGWKSRVGFRVAHQTRFSGRGGIAVDESKKN